MENQNSQLPWEKPSWLEEATNWIQARLAEYGLRSVDPIEILHQRPWSTFARVNTETGIVYFKAPAPVFKFEAPVTAALAKWRPDCTVPLLGVDQDRGWILSADAGPTLRSLNLGSGQIRHWTKILPLYAELQMQMVVHLPELLAYGMFDQRLANLQAKYSQILEDTESLLLDREIGLSQEEYQRLQALKPVVAKMCEQLASLGIPETLTHEEIHENNVLFSEGRYIFTDWSDSSIAHPFFSILVTLRSVTRWLDLDESGPEVLLMRDAYLEPWIKFAPRDTLLEAFGLAYRLAMVNKALTWYHGSVNLSKKQKEPYADMVPGWLQEFLKTSPSIL